MKKSACANGLGLPLRKTLLIMRISAVLLLLAMQVSGTNYGQNLNLKEKNISLSEVFKKIENQSNYRFYYSNDIIPADKFVSVDATNASLKDVLKEVFVGSNLIWNAVNKNRIVVSSKTGVTLNTFPQALAKKITGTITNEKGEPLDNVSIVVKGTTIGTITDAEGKFAIEVADGNAVLEITRVGYETKVVNVTSGETLNIVLDAVKSSMDEVVVVGYGTQKKENLTGAVSQIKMAEVLGDRPVINTTSALQGAIPGLQITRIATPGQNNNAINIRGQLSINGGEPLILIDNVPGDLGMLNPEDVETVTVLKDAASAAIYGARAAGGVIIVTTKRPKSGARFQITYNNNFGSERAIGTPVQSSLEEYLSAYIDAGFNDKYWASSQSVTAWRQYLRDYKTDPSKFTILGDGIYVDPQKAIYYLNDKNLYNNFLTNGFLNSHNVSFSGGTDKVRYRMSGGYDSENGPLITNKDFFKRLSTTAFVSADLTKWFTQEVDIKYSQATKTMPTDEAGGLYTLRLVNYYPEGNMPGSLMLNTKTDVPLFTPKNIILNSNTGKTLTNNPRLYFKSIIKPLPGLEGVFEYTYSKSDTSYSYYSGKWAYSTIQLAATTVPQNDYYVK